MIPLHLAWYAVLYWSKDFWGLLSATRMTTPYWPMARRQGLRDYLMSNLHDNGNSFSDPVSPRNPDDHKVIALTINAIGQETKWGDQSLTYEPPPPRCQHGFSSGPLSLSSIAISARLLLSGGASYCAGQWHQSKPVKGPVRVSSGHVYVHKEAVILNLTQSSIIPEPIAIQWL